MAKIPCEIIRDLLPLYQDDICSEKSRNAIEEHIKECESCRTYLKKMEGEIPIETDKIEGTDEEYIRMPFSLIICQKSRQRI